MWVNPTEAYVKVMVDGAKWILSSVAAEKLKLQAKDIEILETFPGSRIVGKNCKTVHDNRDIPILPANFVDVYIATGVVYSVPGHAPFDYIALRNLWQDPSELNRYRISTQEVRDIEYIEARSCNSYRLQKLITNQASDLVLGSRKTAYWRCIRCGR